MQSVIPWNLFLRFWTLIIKLGGWIANRNFFKNIRITKLFKILAGDDDDGAV